MMDPLLDAAESGAASTTVRRRNRQDGGDGSSVASRNSADEWQLEQDDGGPQQQVPPSDAKLNGSHGGMPDGTPPPGAGYPCAGDPGNDAVFQLYQDTFSSSASSRTSKRKFFFWRIVVGVASAAFLTAWIAIFTEMSTLTAVTFIIPIVVAPYSIYAQGIIFKLPTLRFVLNQTRLAANYLMVQNAKFARENNRLEMEVQRLNQVAHDLRKICRASQSSLQQFQRLLDENSKTQKEIKKLQDARQLQDLLSAILLSDANQDCQLSAQEMDMLHLRLKCFSVVDEERLKRALGILKVTDASTSDTQDLLLQPNSGDGQGGVQQRFLVVPRDGIMMNQQEATSSSTSRGMFSGMLEGWMA